LNLEFYYKFISRQLTVSFKHQEIVPVMESIRYSWVSQIKKEYML